MLHEKLTPEIHDLESDEIITSPGFYRLPIDRHHGQPCDGPSVTSGQLRNLNTHGPEYVWSFSPLNTDRYERPETDALREGRAMAALVEGGLAELEAHFMVLAHDRPNRPTLQQLEAIKAGTATRSAYKAYDYWSKVDADHRTPITETQFETIVAMGKKLADDPIASAALRGLPEITMAWFDEATQLWVLSRPDILTFDGMNTDFKKVGVRDGQLTTLMVDKKIDQFRYDMQLALAVEAMEELGMPRPTTNGLVFQMDTAPYSILPRALSDDDIEIGRFENRRQRRIFRDHLDAGHWPGPGENVGEYRRREAETERYMEEMSA